MDIVVVPHDPGWRRKYETEAEAIRAALGPAVLAIHHVGSTAVAGIYAKPIIDILVEGTSTEAVDRRAPCLVANGYEAMGEFGIRERRYFRKDNPEGIREYHVHAYPADSEQVARHLAFRDYLRSHPGVAQEYSRLKYRLAAEFPSDSAAYVSGKAPFIEATERAALAWWRPA